MPRITFGIIVLNGEPFVLYNLRALYPHAHEIIIVEGAAPGAWAISTSEGHSRDGTLDSIRRFIRDEDPERKVRLVTAEDEGLPNGFWPGEKDQQSQAYAKRATGDLLWQVDCDEFYLPEAIEKMRRLFAEDSQLMAASVHQITFWGALNVMTDSWYLRRGASACRRVFRWKPGYRYTSHRPPTIVDEQGRSLNTMKSLRARETSELGITMYHYSLLLPKQVREKCDYYSRVNWTERPHAVVWAEESYFALMRPYRVHNVYDHPSWLDRYDGPHPPIIEAMMRDIRDGKHDIELRPMSDAERLLSSMRYRLGRLCLKFGEYASRWVWWLSYAAHSAANRWPVVRRLRQRFLWR